MSEHAAATQEALQRIYQRTAHGLTLGLDATFRLFAALDCPCDPFPIIHIAGTNGKGSTAAMLSAVLHRAGYRVGRFTSPHLVRFNERFVVGEEEISDEALEHMLATVEAAASAEDALHPERPISFFELCTVLAIQWFRDENVDIAIVETGLGGRLDSTSVLQPVLSVLTRIDIDHTAWLGDTLEEIAGEKAGILKSGVPVVIGQQQREAFGVISEKAMTLACPLLLTDEVQIMKGLASGESKVTVSSPNEDYGRLTPSLPGDFQWENIATTITAAEWLMDHGFPTVDRASVRQGLEQVQWPGRAQVLHEDPLTILDCAHNPSGLRAVLTWAKQKAKGAKMGILFSACDDKDVSELAAIVSRHCDEIWICELDTPRAASLEVVSKAFQQVNRSVSKGDFQQMLKEAQAYQRESGATLLIAGSCYLVGMMMNSQRDPGELF